MRGNGADGAAADGQEQSAIVPAPVDRDPALRPTSSQHKGVSWSKAAKKWQARTRDKNQKKLVHLGNYVNEEDAARAVTAYIEHGTMPQPSREKNAEKTSEVKGVSWHKESKKWRAQLMDKGKRVYLGYHAEEEEAVAAVNAYVKDGTVPPRPARARCAERTSEKKGVNWSKASQKWKALVTIKGTRKYLGYYESEEDAARAVSEYVKDGTLPTPPARAGRPGTTSAHRGVSYNKDRKKWVGQVWDPAKRKQTNIGSYPTEEDAAKAVAEFIQHGVVQNPPPKRERGTSSHKGVCWDKIAKKWKAQTSKNGKKVHLGYYANDEDAGKAVAQFLEHGIMPKPMSTRTKAPAAAKKPKVEPPQNDDGDEEAAGADRDKEQTTTTAASRVTRTRARN